MFDEAQENRGAGGGPVRGPLHWQSQAVLLAFVPLAATWIVLVGGQAWQTGDAALAQAAVISVGFAALAYQMRAATRGAALTGGIFTAALYLQTPGWRTALWPLLALYLMTHIATRYGRRRKEALGMGEGKRGRVASQVAANLGVAVLAGIPISAAHVFSVTPFGGRAAVMAMIAAMAEATADTISSEMGQVLGGEPRLITTFQRVPVGTDGAITLVGTLTGCLAAAVLVSVAAFVLPMRLVDALIALSAGIVGLFVDSLLGAIPERRGWLNNDAVNALSTLAAALLAAESVRFLPGL
jgi:uncharacterized protein (TIGR00297 family)